MAVVSVSVARQAYFGPNATNKSFVAQLKKEPEKQYREMAFIVAFEVSYFRCQNSLFLS